jgi:hypothetical protein
MKYGYGVTETVIRNLIETVLQDRAAQSAALIAALRSGPVSVDDRERMRECLADELLETGLEGDTEPNERGRLIEAAIDWLGRRPVPQSE